MQGTITIATVADHIIPHKGDEVLFWDEINLQGLCKEHHDSDKQRQERGLKARVTYGKDGWPVS